MKVDLDQLIKTLKDTFGPEEKDYRSCFYAGIGWEEVKNMMNELRAAREIVRAAKIISSSPVSKLTGPDWDRLADALKDYEK